jgi:hypothetical protein
MMLTPTEIERIIEFSSQMSKLEASLKWAAETLPDKISESERNNKLLDSMANVPDELKGFHRLGIERMKLILFCAQELAKLPPFK